MQTLLDRAARLIVRARWPLLALGLVATVASFIASRGLTFDRSVENMFAADDPLLGPYRQLKRTFGGNEIVVAAYVDTDLMSAAGLTRLDTITHQLEQLAEVGAAVSLTNTPLGRRIGDGSPVAERFVRLLEDYAVSADRRTAAVACLLRPETDSEQRDATIAAMRAILAEHAPGGGVLAGEPVMVVEGFRAIKEDGRRLGWISSGLLLLTIVYCFRSLRWVIVPLAVVNFALLVTEAALVVSGLRLSMVSSMLWAIVTVIGIATVVHVTIAFREARQRGLPSHDALAATLSSLAAPVFWTVTTDAVGFAALLAASVGPVQDFGLMMTCGALMVGVGLIAILPGLALAGSFDADPHNAWGEESLGGSLARLLDRVLARPMLVLATTFAVAALAAVGGAFVEVETDFTKNFRAGSPVVQAYDLVESNLRGSGVWDIVVPAPEKLDHAFLARLRDLQSELARQLPYDEATGSGITKSLSLADMLDVVPDNPLQWAALLPRPNDRVAGVAQPLKLDDLGVSPAELAKFAFSPPTAAELTPIKLAAMRALMPDVYRTLHGVDPEQPGRHFARIMLRSRERQSSHAKRHLIERVTEISRASFAAADRSRSPLAPREESGIHDSSRPEGRTPDGSAGFSPLGDPTPFSEPQVTGYFVLLASLINSMVRDQWLTLGLATAAIWLMLAVGLRSLAMATIALVPNLIPILMITGVMGWLGLRINMGAAMIASVSMGLAVDSSIHYIVDFQRRCRAGQSPAEALHGVQQSVGRAVMLSTLALMVGFSALAFSEFVPIVTFGVLVSLTMLGGMVGNLIVLPLLLHLLTTRLTRRRTPSGESRAV